MGGEECATVVKVIRWEGLPPRGRGRGLYTNPQNRPLRITPAWAGKSRWQVPCYPVARDYPRVGGEELYLPRRLLTLGGLPPRGRGRERSGDLLICTERITPAWAGKRRLNRPSAFPRGDYPRVGGEEVSCYGLVALAGGLPPRGRGRAIDAPATLAGPWITPAWAGKSK